MRARIFTFFLLALVATLARPEHTSATEVCGDGQDNNNNSLADEGCQPHRVSGQTEAPLPSQVTGVVSPKSGQLIWTEPPDLSPSAPYGPPLIFQRTYLSHYDPGYNAPGATNYRAPMGYGWHHGYMGWVDAYPSQSPAEAVVHLVTGQDVLFTYASNDGTYDYYTAQPGHHFIHLRQNTSTDDWELKTLDGWIYEYAEQVTGTDTSKLTAIQDSLGNALTIAYDGTSGQIDTVTDASGVMELSFSYGTTGARTLTGIAFSSASSPSSITYDNSYTPGIVEYDDGSARSYAYDGTRLSRVFSSGDRIVATFAYLATGEVARIETPSGYLGYDYGACNSGQGVFIYYNAQDTLDGDPKACDADADCNTGSFCGGEYDPGGTDTGVCFQARRCAAWVSGNEDLIGAVTSSCSTCTDTADRAWDTTSVDLDGKKDADNVWTSYEYDANGLVKKLVENDTDSNGSTVPSGARVTWFKYTDSNFPGLVTEVRRLSELKPGGTCSASTVTDCKRTLYVYTTTGQLDRLREIGFTYDATGAVVAYDFSTLYTYDTQGRVTKIRGPRTDTSDDVLDFTYHPFTGTEADHAQGQVHEVKRKVASGTFVTTENAEYDLMGNPKTIVEPNGNLMCLDFTTRNALAQQIVRIGGQTTCGTPDTGDLVTTYTYLDGIRPSTIQMPEGNCRHFNYSLGLSRLESIGDRDDCDPDSDGDTQIFTYNVDGLGTKVEYKYISGVISTHFRRETTYGVDRRLSEILNPATASKKKTYTYKADGMIESIVGEDGIGKTEWAYDNFNRTDTEKRYNTSSTFDTWDVLPGIQLDLPRQVEDDDNKAIDWVWDDMGRKVKQVTPDNGTSIKVYDPAGNLVTHVEALGSADEMTHTYTYDPQNRLLSENYGDPSCFSLGGAEIQYTYDTTSGCPTGACENVNGRLAYVKTKVACDSNDLIDNTFDQFTYFKYDDAGRTVAETITDDGGRDITQTYAWDKNGNPVSVTPDSGVAMKWTYGSGGSNSDRDRIVSLIRNAGSDVTFASEATWYPFGQLESYKQGNTISGNNLIVKITRDLAYRVTDILWEQTSGTDLFEIAYTLDDQGRITVKDFTGGHGELDDSYYTYDWQNRITCDATVSGSCPTSGGNVKSNLNSTPPYTASSDRKSIIHRSNQYPIATLTHTLVTGKDQIDSIARGSQTIDLGWDARGNRLYDDDDEYADDRRDYTYDGRNNLIAVSGKLKISDTVVHDYTAVNAYDHKNRRFFKSILDETTDDEEQWFYYYDLDDRIIEVVHTPDMDDTSIFTVFQFYWIGQRPVAWVQTNYPGATGNRRFFHADHLNTPVEAYNWPTSGDAARSWAMQSDAFGWAAVLAGTAYQPLRFPGQMSDDETTAWYWDSTASLFKRARPPLSDNRYRVYDPLTASYLQVDPMVGSEWNSYAYAGNNGVLNADPNGLWVDLGSGGGGGGGTWDIWGIGTLWHFFNLPDFWVSPNYEPPPRGGGGHSPPPPAAVECPPVKDCKNESINLQECLECCESNFVQHDLCECEKIVHPGVKTECIDRAILWLIECKYLECQRFRDIGPNSPGTWLDGFGGGQFGGGGAGGSFLRFNPYGESLISEPEVYQR
jgi:YD repeat-containing protein